MKVDPRAIHGKEAEFFAPSRDPVPNGTRSH